VWKPKVPAIQENYSRRGKKRAAEIEIESTSKIETEIEKKTGATPAAEPQPP
jgi:hypothetical protein